MSRIEALNRRYAASASLARHGVEIVVVGDPSGARLNVAARRLLTAVRDDGPGLWDDLVVAVKSLRWRRVTQPQPTEFNPGIKQGAEEVGLQARHLRGAVVNEDLLDELGAAAEEVAEIESAIGLSLLHSIEGHESEACVVVAANRPARAGLEGWLSERGVLVLTAGELEREQPRVDRAYVVGPPRFFKSSLVTAPVSNEVSFLVPAWFGDRTVPRSAIAPYAEGAISIEGRLVAVGDTSESESQASASEVDDDLVPEPLWGSPQSPDREPTSTEVEAQKVLLSGNLAIWLDDGERIRALDPEQPVGERVIYTDVSAVRAGSYLLLRQGATERGALYQAALGQLGSHSETIDATQGVWKRRLAARLSELGYGEVVRRLRAAGVVTADRARAWTEPSLIRPHSDRDFERVLGWLGITTEPTFGYATRLRKALYQASADFREELETAVSGADLSILERDGYLSLDVQTEGIRGILATRVLAISPFREIVARHDARVPFEDRSGQWLE